MGYRLSTKAEEDIIRIAEAGLYLFGEAQALLYHNELFAIFDLIALNPEIARERHELTPLVRIHPHKSHLIVYLVEENRNVLIVRVRHGHEDWESDLL